MNKRLLLILALAATIPPLTLDARDTFDNPVIAGCHPDPSICRVGDDFYVVTSSCAWFPGIPVFHSRDLMHWEQIGYVMDRPSQLPLKDGTGFSNGIWAPTIRYHSGLFYVSCTAHGAGGNFYVTAENAEGPWSEPVYIDAPGIDGSLFFDDDGKCWYTGSINGTPDEDRYLHEDRIFIQELDLSAGKLIGERRIICSGHAVNAPFAEAPHIYKIGGRYYLFIAEGATWKNHAVTVFTSDNVTGPFEAGIANPVLTHRFLGKSADINSVGHADLVQDKNGKWWAVVLGIRPYKGFNMLGRETFLTSVEFQNGWPVFNPGKGRVLMKDKATGLGPYIFDEESPRDEFLGDKLGLCWNFLRTPFEKWYELSNGQLIMNLRKESLAEPVNPSLIARRVDRFVYAAQTEMTFLPSGKGEEAGMIIMLTPDNHYRLVKEKKANHYRLVLYKTNHKETEEVGSIVSTSEKNVLKIICSGLTYQFFAGDDDRHLSKIGDDQDATVNSREKAGGLTFTGPYVGMYASSNGEDSSAKAIFEYFSYQ